MDRDIKNRIIDDAVRDITSHPGSYATLVVALSGVFSEGYKYGLSQGRRDKEQQEGSGT